MKKNCVSYHPNWGENGEEYFLPKGATKLVIGSMPPRRLCVDEKGCKLVSVKSDKINTDIDFFYGSKDNYFWNILNYIDINGNKTINEMSEVERMKIDKEKRCKDILKKYDIGIVDVVFSCIHNENDEGQARASDDDLLDIKPIELIEILKNNKSIDTIFCTSKFVKTLLGIYYAEHISYDNNSKSGTITFKGIAKPYTFYVLYSPTRRVFNMFKNKTGNYMKNYFRLLDVKINGNECD